MRERMTLDELLADPMIQLVMKRDRVDADKLRMLVTLKTRPDPLRSVPRALPMASLPAPHVIDQACRIRALSTAKCL